MAATGGRALDNVSVTLALGGGGTAPGLPATVKTDSSGNFSFDNEPIGSYTLTFVRTGFTTKSVGVGNTIAGPTTLGVTLASDTTPGVDAPTFQLTVSSSNGGADPSAVGFGTTVTLGVTALADPGEPSLDPSKFTYAWKVTTAGTPANPTGKYSFNTAPTPSSTSAAFDTMTVAQVKAVEQFDYPSPTGNGSVGYVGRLGVLGINPDETGSYTVAVTVADAEGHNYTFSEGIKSAWQAPRLRDVPVGNPVYLQGDTFAQPNWMQQGGSYWKWLNTSWTWTVVSAPQGSTVNTAALVGANTQYPSFTPDVVGDYVFQVVETSSMADAGTVGPGLDAGPGPNGSYGSQTSSVTVHAGTWLGIMNGNNTTCVLCHKESGLAPDMFTPWQNTAHASALQRKLDGLAAGNHFGESCMECHTTGWSEVTTAQTPTNGGFYYTMNTEKDGNGKTWEFPTNNLKPGTYSDMVTNYPGLGKLAGIQCENCHGPAAGPATNHTPGNLEDEYRNARIDWSAQTCGSCHQENWHHNFPGQWGPSPHGDVKLAIQRATVESKATAYGGGADPQGGAQHCARCHSAQGFSEYVDMLNNGASGRYDFITTDDMPLKGDNSNAPTPAYLSGLGLNAADVQSQTCVTCHDPHSNEAYGAKFGVDCSVQANNANPACAQLRIYDGLPKGLPNGMSPFAGVGAGAVCMACHNGRNGEHTDFKDTSPYAETPHDSTATEAIFGYNAYWVPRYNPSPHMAVKDTCVGCHTLPTDDEKANGITLNHAFETDLTICKNCHGSSGVDGAAIQAQVASEMSNMSAAIIAAVTNGIKATNANGPLCVRAVSVSNANCTGGSCASSQVPTAVPYPLAPSNVQIPQGGITSVTMSSGGTTSVTINLAANVSFPYYDPKTLLQVGTANTNKLSVSITTIQNNACGGGPVYVFPPSDYRAKAIWNYVTLQNEGSGGIHNLPWTNAVIGATMQHLQAGN